MQVEDRTECRESGAVSYKRDVANVLALEIDPAAATNKEELDEYKVQWLQVASPACQFLWYVLLGSLNHVSILGEGSGSIGLHVQFLEGVLTRILILTRRGWQRRSA